MPLAEHDHIQEQSTGASAWDKHPHAATVEAAQAAEALRHRFIDNHAKRIDLAKAFDTAVNPVRATHEAALKAWEDTPKEERYILPSSTRVAVSKSLMADDEGIHARTEIFNDSYSMFEMNPAYTRWQQNKSADLLESIQKNPTIKEAEKNWNNPAFGIREKIKFAQELHNTHAETFGFKAVNVEPFIEEPESMLDHEGNPTDTTILTNGYLLGDENKLALNIYRSKDRSATIHADFASFVDLVIHEGEHAFQDQLGERAKIVRGAENSTLQDLGVDSTKSLSPEGLEIYKSELDRRIKMEAPDDPGNWNKELSGDGALAAHAEYMHHNYKESYISSNGNAVSYEGYQSNPIEKEARHLGVMISGYFDRPESDRSNYIAAQRYGAHQSDMMESDRLLERATVARQRDALAP